MSATSVGTSSGVARRTESIDRCRLEGGWLRDDQPVADVQLSEAEKLAVSRFPGAVRQVGAEPVEARVYVAELREGRDRAARAGVEVRRGPSPVRAEEAVG